MIPLDELVAAAETVWVRQGAIDPEGDYARLRDAIDAARPSLPSLIESVRREAAAYELLRAAHRGDWCQLPGDVWNEINALLHDNAGTTERGEG